MLVRMICKCPIVEVLNSSRLYLPSMEGLIAWVGLQTFESREMDGYSTN
jgi:hypothetical protein